MILITLTALLKMLEIQQSAESFYNSEASQKPPIDPDRATDHRARRLRFSDKFSVQVGERINLWFAWMNWETPSLQLHLQAPVWDLASLPSVDSQDWERKSGTTNRDIYGFLVISFPWVEMSEDHKKIKRYIQPTLTKTPTQINNSTN